MTDHLDDELEYEPFEDVEWTDPDELDAIDLDVLDDEIDETPNEDRAADQPAAAQPEPATSVPTPPRPVSRPISRPAKPVSRPAAQPEPPPIEAGAETHIEAETPRATKPAASPEPVAKSDATAPEAVPVEVTPIEVAPVKTDQPAPPVIPPEVYCAVLALPPEIGAGVLELRATGGIETMPPPGVILTPHFRTQQLDAVKTALAGWTRIHLPMQLEITALKAEVVGAQQYIAAWALEPQEELQDAIYALRQMLANVILPMPGTTNTIGTHIMIGDHVPAPRYPHVISQMQRDFEPEVWQSTDLQLVHYVPIHRPDGTTPSSNDPVIWELYQKFD